MLVADNTDARALHRFGLSAGQARGSLWAFDGSRRWRGAAAVNRILAELGGPWRAVAALYHVPGIGALEELAYRLVARNRAFLARFWRA